MVQPERTLHLWQALDEFEDDLSILNEAFIHIDNRWVKYEESFHSKLTDNLIRIPEKLQSVAEVRAERRKLDLKEDGDIIACSGAMPYRLYAERKRQTYHDIAAKLMDRFHVDPWNWTLSKIEGLL